MGRNAAIVGLLAALGLASAGGCHDGQAATDGCGPVTREALDPNYLVHVLQDDPSIEYRSDPPTSGPHQPGPPEQGVLDHPLTRPVQVGLLESGDVLLQYRPADVGGADLSDLQALAGDQVVVAPNPDLPAPVVATAWLYKRTCESVTVDPLRDFVDARAGKGPDQR